ncbi:uncharacterized protein VICG_01977 [Vittaforma corneae ATCC 50505]|uniref:SGS domain-containing protein n=1 Tax=Vittaforma corneae (strain ATCC 50505) TaxID=993615 RepID=L2GJG4_VITCO|nr:uncharacterized protein VICG_01977 [Vittaforma corneae ATCC 50505]ELA41018.1 hypothetical protein VICG_01977 [Vittaforma corneae ATCC 50505]
MAANFSFAETHTEVLITFYKAPNDVKSGVSEVVSPEIKLKDSATLMYNTEEISLHAAVQLVSIEDSKYKTEVVLKKETPSKWNCLSGKVEVLKVRDEIYKDDQEQSNPQDMMELFKDIYAKGDDDVKRAMNKSLKESAGTVLSTNWKDVSSKKVNPEK